MYHSNLMSDVRNSYCSELIIYIYHLDLKTVQYQCSFQKGTHTSCQLVRKAIDINFKELNGRLYRVSVQH